MALWQEESPKLNSVVNLRKNDKQALPNEDMINTSCGHCAGDDLCCLEYQEPAGVYKLDQNILRGSSLRGRSYSSARSLGLTYIPSTYLGTPWFVTVRRSCLPSPVKA